MDQVYNSMLNMMPATPERQPAKPQPQEKDSFQTQMKQAAGQNGKTEAQTPVQDQTQTQEGQPVAAEDPQELEKQMALAAMAVMQNPVIPVEQTAAPEETQMAGVAQVELVVPVDGKGIQAPPAEAAETAEIPLEEVADEAVEQLPQERARPVETAPQTVEDTGAEMEVQVTAAEHGEAGQETEDQDTPEEGMSEAPVFQDVREIPVKVGEAPRTEEVREVPVEDQIGPRIAEALEQGDTRVEIQLAPENLGKVTVEVTLHEDGALHIALHAENSQTRGLLERSADSLMAMLGRDARQEVQVEVPRQQESQQQNFYDQQKGHEQQQQQQQEHRRERQSGEDFLHQLRLGLVPGDGE